MRFFWYHTVASVIPPLVVPSYYSKFIGSFGRFDTRRYSIAARLPATLALAMRTLFQVMSFVRARSEQNILFQGRCLAIALRMIYHGPLVGILLGGEHVLIFQQEAQVKEMLCQQRATDGSRETQPRTSAKEVQHGKLRKGCGFRLPLRA